MSVDKGKVVAWLDEKWTGDHACPICRKTSWAIATSLSAVMSLDDDGALNLSDGDWPSVQVVCETCGYIMHFSASVLGLLLPEQEG